MIVAADVIRAGIWRRACALCIDLVVAHLILQLIAAALFGVSGGRIIDTASFSTSCTSTSLHPAGAEIPAGFEPTARSICVKSLLGLQTARLYVVENRATGPVATTTNLTFPLDAAGEVANSFDIGSLLFLMFVVARWTMDRHGQGSLGRRLCGNRLVRFATQDDGQEDASWVTRRYILFGLPVVPGLVMNVFGLVWGLSIGPLSPGFLGVAGAVATVPLWIAALHARRSIARYDDAFYDKLSGTAVAIVTDGAVEIADGPAPSPTVVPRLRALLTDRTRRIIATWPRVTMGLVGVLAAIHLAEVLHPATPAGPNGVAIPTLVLFGGADRELVVQIGQWYRLLFAPFLHGSLAHVVGNGLAILAAGWVLEGLLGRTWLLAVFILGGVSGSTASILWNDPRMIGIGASGALMALLAAGYAVSGGLAQGPRRAWIEAFCLGMGLPLLASAGHLAIGTVDVADHVGGAIGGTALGMIMLALWRYPAPRPRFGTAALGSAVAVAAALMISIPLAGFGDAQMSALLIPADRLPKTDAEWLAQCADLLRRYPSDPRARLAQAVLDENAGDIAQRNRDLDQALADSRRFNPPNDHAFESNAMLVMGAAAEKRQDETAALTYFTRAVAIDPNAATPRAKRADVEVELQSYDAALADLDALAKLQPRNGRVEMSRGDTLFAAGRLDEAIQAYDAATALAPDDAVILRQRGWERFYAGQQEAALHDLEKSVAEDPKDAYAAIWLDIVAVRTGLADRMAAVANQLDLKTWPGPVVRFYRRDIDEQGLLAAAAASADAKDDQRCEANFYIGEWLIMSHDDRAARPYLAAARTSCPPSFNEWAAVKAELEGTAGYDPDPP